MVLGKCWKISFDGQAMYAGPRMSTNGHASIIRLSFFSMFHPKWQQFEKRVEQLRKGCWLLQKMPIPYRLSEMKSSNWMFQYLCPWNHGYFQYDIHVKDHACISCCWIWFFRFPWIQKHGMLNIILLVACICNVYVAKFGPHLSHIHFQLHFCESDAILLSLRDVRILYRKNMSEKRISSYLVHKLVQNGTRNTSMGGTIATHAPLNQVSL